MPRDSSGTMSLPAGNPVVSGTAISSTVTNNTLSDISTEITDSLSRSGKGPMTAPLELANGSAATPALSFDSDTDTGLFRKGANSIGIAVGGVEVGNVSSSGLTMTGLVVEPGGRLTLTTAVPVTTSDVTGATTVYYTPHRHNALMLYDGTNWVPTAFSEMSQATTDTTKSPAAVANDSNYDMFVWSDSGTLRCTRGPAWSSSTSRGTGAGTTELEFVSGRYVNKVAITNGPAAQRGLYVGTIRSDGSAQINDAAAKRHMWNAYSRVERKMVVLSPAGTWSYSTDSYRQANASTDLQLDLVIGLAGDLVKASVRAMAKNTAAAGAFQVSIGLDSTTTAAVGGTINGSNPGVPQVANIYFPTSVEFSGAVAAGRHTLVWLERASGASITWGGLDTIAGSITVNSSISGTLLA